MDLSLSLVGGYICLFICWTRDINCVISLNKETANLAMTDDSDFILKWENHEQNRTSTLKSLLENEDFLDVTIACDDDQIYAHKVILAAASPLFRNILKRNPHSHPLLYLRGTTTKDMKAIFNFIYSGETHVVQEELQEFMALADSLKIVGLVGEKFEVNDGKYEEYDKKLGVDEKSSVEVDEYFEQKGNKAVDFNPRSFGHKSIKSGNKPCSKKKLLPTKKDDPLVNTKSNAIEYELSDVRKESSGSDVDMKRDAKKIVSTKTEALVKDALVVELSEEIIEMDEDISSIMKRYNGSESFEENLSFQSRNTSTASLTEYDEKVLELLFKTDSGWSCKECAYKSVNVGHAREHVEKHITGHSHDCKYCDKTFSKKRNLRHHIRKCKTSNRITGEN